LLSLQFFGCVGVQSWSRFYSLGWSGANAQWDIEESHTTASLRGIHNVGAGVAWASGTNGTVLRTEDGGYLWQTCTIPVGGEKLDFRGIQAFDANTAIVMSSGKGDLSRLYKTTDGCQTWKLLFTNPDKEGFWDGIIGAPDPTNPDIVYGGRVVGDPVGGKFTLLYAFIINLGNFGIRKSLELLPAKEDKIDQAPEPLPLPGESLFAASNSAAINLPDHLGFLLGTGGSNQGPRVIANICRLNGDHGYCHVKTSAVPMAIGPAAGVFSLAARTFLDHCLTDSEWNKFKDQLWPPPPPRCDLNAVIVAVGGDYTKPDERTGTAAFMLERPKDWLQSPETWTAAQTPPHGYRSAVAYDSTTKTWITVGPNGTDISRDDGKNWSALKPSAQDPPDADKNWNALSLPFVVGPKGRIGKLHPKALAP
jgi:hypothetical protein